MWLHNVHINPYSHRGYVDHDPKRKRRLLLHKHEIRKLIGKTVEKGLTLVPTRMYFKNGKIKVGDCAGQAASRRTTSAKHCAGARSIARPARP